MLQQKEYEKHFFVYNDNEEAYKSGHFRIGKGNAIIRPYKKIGRAYGIPTGTLKYRGYKFFTKEIKDIIDTCIDEIIKICKKK
jgi:hypothetical protein